MASSYTTNKNIEKPANGDYNNTWSVPVNNDWDIIDRAFGGTTSLNAVGASGTVTLTATQYQAPIIAITGTLTANVNYQLPSNIGGFWYIFNNTSGAFSITFSSAGGGSTVTLPQGYTVAVISDGTNIGLGTTNAALISSTYANPSWITSLAISKLTGTLPIANGGTNATTAGGALTNLGAAASGTNTDITSLNASAGIQVGSPTAGAKGAGTINATGLFVNGVAVGVSGGSVSSVSGSGGTTGMTLTGGPITTSGTLTLGGTLAIANGGTGATSGAAALSALGGVPTSGTGATGTWGISISGNAATATSATSATSATTATTATTANALNSANSYSMVNLTASGSITASGNVTAYSDAKLKTDMAQIRDALDKVDTLTGYTYTRLDTGHRETGLIAQDVQAVLPEAVADNDGTLSLAYGNLVGLLVEAIKDLRAEVDELRGAK